ncbi:uncharacterized protein LOC119173336 isoform X5 [Rhipicephalus microplus]|uniref:uncharacterized protein LOC119173336 isoform X5 n=1 Tax=Rhipicephalus microplus TaxID=6941 RepID=UPI003F6D06A6
MKRTALYRVTFLCIALQTVEAVGLPRIGGIPGHVFNLAASAPWCFHGIFTGVLEICGLEMSPVGKFMPVVVRFARGEHSPDTNPASIHVYFRRGKWIPMSQY